MTEHKIGWLNVEGLKGETWNPIIGCIKCSPGCANCYAERMAFRLAAMGQEQYHGVVYGEGDTNVAHPEKTHLKAHWNGKTAFVESALDKPLHWKSPRLIFVCSMGDLFHETVELTWLAEIFAIMAMTPQHKYLLLTKRPDRMKKCMEDLRDSSLIEMATHKLQGFQRGENIVVDKTFPNVGGMVTICTQEEADRNTPLLLKTPFAMRGVSIEPMLEGVSLFSYDKELGKPYIGRNYLHKSAGLCDENGNVLVKGKPRLDWVIVGGESGHNARPMHPDWARKIQKQCEDAGVPFFFKQWGEWASICPRRNEPGANAPSGWVNLDGSYFLSGTKTINIKPGNAPVTRIGRAAAGHLLDGKEYRQYPEWVTKQ